MLIKLSVALLSSCFLVTMIGACGSSDSGGGSLTRAEFVKQGNAICSKAEVEKNDSLKAALRKLGESNQTLTKARQVELVSTVALPPIRQMTEELGGLGAPSDEEAAVEAMVEAFETEVERLEADPASVVNGSGGSFAPANKLAKAFGMKACAAI